MSQLPKRKASPDSYRPVIVPQAVKWISQGKQDERNEQEMSHTVPPLSSKPGKSIAHTTYEEVYSTDLQRSAKWYYRAFGFYITNANSEFTIVQMAPGRILNLNSKNIKQPMKVGFVTKNMNALKRQLIKENIPFESEEEHQLKVKDPDGNIIVIRTSGYGMEHLNAYAPEKDFRWRARVRLDTREKMHVLAKKIKDDVEFDRASEEVMALCKREGIAATGEAFIVSECRHLSESQPWKPRPTKVENMFACIAITDAFDCKLPEGMEFLTIPAHDYTVHPIDYSRIDTLRSEVFGWQTDFMAWSFTRPEGNFYILEHYKEDYIYISIPYYWDIGWEEQRRIREEQQKNEKGEGGQK